MYSSARNQERMEQNEGLRLRPNRKKYYWIISKQTKFASVQGDTRSSGSNSVSELFSIDNSHVSNDICVQKISQVLNPTDII
jgi:hypothetical protein